MKKKILKELLKRPGMSEQDWELLEDMIHDSIIDMRSYLNYEDEESLPEGVIPAVKELTLIRFNKDGVEGIASESQSFGGSTTYMDALPDQVKKITEVIDMSINRDMKSYRLQKEETVRTPSGAEKQKWIDMGGVKAAVYKKNDMKVAASATYLESTHIGLTRCKSIKAEGYRLVKDDVVYRIIDCNPQGRMTNLLLKVVE